jgi:hypothetical protein
MVYSILPLKIVIRIEELFISSVEGSAMFIVNNSDIPRMSSLAMLFEKNNLS